MQRSCGVLLPVFSLPSKYGIGSFGKGGYEFIDFLASAGQKIWQILPLVQTGYGNSPYSSVSSESFNPYYIDLDILKEEGLLTSAEVKNARMEGKIIDYSALYTVRFPLLRTAFSRFNLNSAPFKRFLKRAEFHDYALFMTIKEWSGYKPFYDWDSPLKYRDANALKEFEIKHKNDLLFWEFVQFQCEKQWNSLKKYANKKGVNIMGDMPFYVALDSVDVWKNPSIFKLDENLIPKKVAGVPPDYFSEKGQLWGNPVYDFEGNSEQCVSWWTNRVKKALFKFDYLRIDHFRALDRYYEIPFGSLDAVNGQWIKTPGVDIIDRINKEIDGNRIIAEDLGIIDDSVRSLLKYAGCPGMKILSFAFNGELDNLYLPENVCENSVCYTGTHDNDTLLGLIKKASDWDKCNIKKGVNRSLELLKVKGSIEDDISLAKSIIELGYKSKANLFIIPLQDILLCDSEYRINEPGTVKLENWAIKFNSKVLNKKLAKKLFQLKEKYNR